MVIVLLNTALRRSAFSTVSFRKLVFHPSVLSLNQDIMHHQAMYFVECPVITRNKKHSPKQVASITYTLEKNFFAAATFELDGQKYEFARKIAV